jgi:hypothetical protein
MRPFRSAILVFLLFAMLPLPLATLAQGNEIYFISDVDCTSAYPNVTFKLRAVDLTNKVVTTLSNSNVTVFENGVQATNVTVTPQNNGPVNYIFVIDQGQLNNYRSFGLPNMKLAISTLVNGGFFVSGTDEVMVMARQNFNGEIDFTWLNPTQQGSDLTTFVANFNFDRSRQRTSGLLAVQEAVNKMVNLVPVQGSETAVIIFITYFVENPATTAAGIAAQSIADVAEAKNITVHVLQTSNFQPSPLQNLAAGANGLYTQLRPSQVVADVSRVYQEITSQRNYYDVSYRSQSSDTGPRTITINAATPTGQGVSGTCQVNVQPPSLLVSAPNPNVTVIRDCQLTAAGQVVCDINDVTVVGDITWPVDQARRITQIELSVDGQIEETVAPTNPEDTHFEIVWDVSDIQIGSTKTVKVVVTDEVGLTATDERIINFQVNVPPTSTPTSCPPIIGCNPTPPPPGGNLVGIILGSLCLIYLCVVPFSFLIFYMTRPTQAKQMVADIRHTLIGGGPATAKSLANVTVVAGPRQLLNEKINITKAITTIGRNPKVADIVFYPDEESSVSRLHCTIQMDGRAFKLTDNGSTSGTRINGRKVQPNDPTELHDGDEVVLGDLGKLGVKLKFGVLADKTQLPSSGTASDKTFIMDDFHSDDWDKYKDN